jgi:putative acetyltransferase
MELRRATPNDVAAVTAIIASVLAEHGLPFEPEGRDADVALFGANGDHDDIVALHEGRIVGLVGVGPHGDPGVAWVSKLFVASDARRLGIGRRLLQAAHEAARARGHREVRLRTRVVFEAAIALYQSAGYTNLGAENAGDLVLSRRI